MLVRLRKHMQWSILRLSAYRLMPRGVNTHMIAAVRFGVSNISVQLGIASSPRSETWSMFTNTRGERQGKDQHRHRSQKVALSLFAVAM